MITTTNFISEEVLMYLEDRIQENNLRLQLKEKNNKSSNEESSEDSDDEISDIKKLPIHELSFKSFFKKDNRSNYYIMDRKSTIQCYFNIKKIKDCLNEENVMLLVKNTKNLVIDVKNAKIDLKIKKTNDKKILPSIVIIIDEFSLENCNILPFKFLNYQHNDVNLEKEVDKLIKKLMGLMQQNNFQGINNKEKINKVWYYSGAQYNKYIELSNIKFNSQNEVEFVGIDLTGINFDIDSEDNFSDDEEDNKEEIIDKKNEETDMEIQLKKLCRNGPCHKNKNKDNEKNEKMDNVVGLGKKVDRDKNDDIENEDMNKEKKKRTYRKRKVIEEVY